MPSIEQSLISTLDMSGLKSSSPNPSVDQLQSTVTRNMFVRCPVPQIGNTSSDTISQSDLRGNVPQYRVWVSTNG